MVGLCWVGVTLTLLLSGGNSFVAVDKEHLADIVKFIMRRYNIKTQVSVAVNIPVKKTHDYLEEVFQRATAAAVQRKLSQGSVYPGDTCDHTCDDTCDNQVVVAKPAFKEQYTDHAEARVLQNIKALVKSSNNHFLLFYSFYSPCGAKCTNLTNRNSIIPSINEVFPNWNQSALVFSRVFDRTSKGKLIDRAEPGQSLKRLGNSRVGHDNIFRCYRPKNKDFQCISCFNGKKPEARCVANDD